MSGNRSNRVEVPEAKAAMDSRMDRTAANAKRRTIPGTAFLHFFISVTSYRIFLKIPYRDFTVE